MKTHKIIILEIFEDGLCIIIKITICDNISKIDSWSYYTVYLITIRLQFFLMHKAAIANTPVCKVGDDVIAYQFVKTVLHTTSAKTCMCKFCKMMY